MLGEKEEEGEARSSKTYDPTPSQRSRCLVAVRVWESIQCRLPGQGNGYGKKLAKRHVMSSASRKEGCIRFFKLAK